MSDVTLNRMIARMPPVTIKVEGGLVTASFIARDMFLRCKLPPEDAAIVMPKPYQEYAACIAVESCEDAREWLARHDRAVGVLLRACRATFRLLETDEYVCPDCNGDQGPSGSKCTNGHPMPCLFTMRAAGASAMRIPPNGSEWPSSMDTAGLKETP